MYCEKIGSSHTLAAHNFNFAKDIKQVKDIFNTKPPYVLKLSQKLEKKFPKKNSSKFKKSNAYHAILMSKRNFVYKHKFEKPISKPSKLNKNTFLKFAKNRLKLVLRNIDRFFYLLKLKFRRIFNP